MSEKATVLVSEAKKVKDGSSAKGPWTLYSVVDGNEDRYSHFSDSLHSAAAALQGKRAEIEYETNDRGKTLTAIKEAAASNGDGPKPGTGEYVTGQKPQIEARRIFASTAQNAANALTDIYFKHMTSREVTPALVLEVNQHFFAQRFLELTRKGDAIRDEDIPFDGGGNV